MFFIGQCAAYLLALNDYINIKIPKQIAFTDLIIWYDSYPLFKRTVQNLQIRISIQTTVQSNYLIFMIYIRTTTTISTRKQLKWVEIALKIAFLPWMQIWVDTQWHDVRIRLWVWRRVRVSNFIGVRVLVDGADGESRSDSGLCPPNSVWIS